MDDINTQKYIYFFSPDGTWTRINKNLEYLGLDKNKKIANTYTKDFDLSVRENTYKNKYGNYDVIYLDEFYDFEIDYELCFKIFEEFVAQGKQIVMAGHGDLDSLKQMPLQMKKQVKSYDLKYDLDWDYSYSIDYIN